MISLAVLTQYEPVWDRRADGGTDGQTDGHLASDDIVLVRAKYCAVNSQLVNRNCQTHSFAHNLIAQRPLKPRP